MTELTFKGKEFVYNHHLSVPFRPLVPHAEKGIGDVNLDGNLIIQGDNLHALKALLPRYAGKVDCIYIDPPYNTGTEDWSYNDNVNSPMIKEWLAANPISIEDGLRHDKWCAMMWPRLRLLRELLSDQGLIFISINSIEVAPLKLLCEEIFGQESYVGEFVWKSRNNKDNRNESGMSNDHEFVLVFGSALDGELRSAEDYENSDGDNRGPWASANMVGLASKESRPNLHYDLINPETKINYGCPKRGWRFEPSTMNRLIDERRVLWPTEPTGRPRRKAFLSELDARTNVSSAISGPFYTNNGSKTFEQILPEETFPFPKPTELLQFILALFERKDLLILDSFAGSGTTAHAVVNANHLDAGSRRFICVEMEEYADRKTAERVRRVMKGYKFQGKLRKELLREKITLTKLRKAQSILNRVEGIENLEAINFDEIKKEIKDGELIVTGEKTVAERVEGLGGTFTYCTLGPPVELDKILTGKDLPAYEALGSVLYHMATNRTLESSAIRQSDFHLGEHGNQHVWLIYKPELDWLKGPDAALTLGFARKIAADYPGKDHLVFAASRFVSEKLLGEEGLRVEFVPLPFALYRIEKV